MRAAERGYGGAASPKGEQRGGRADHDAKGEEDGVRKVAHAQGNEPVPARPRETIVARAGEPWCHCDDRVPNGRRAQGEEEGGRDYRAATAAADEVDEELSECDRVQEPDVAACGDRRGDTEVEEWREDELHQQAWKHCAPKIAP